MMTTPPIEPVLMDQCLFVPVRGQRYERVAKDQIRFFQAEGSWVDVVTTSARHRISTNLGEVARQLDPAQFVRVSRQHVINIQRVSALFGNHVVIDEEDLLIGKQYREALLERLPILRTKAGDAAGSLTTRRHLMAPSSGSDGICDLCSLAQRPGS